MLWQFFLLELCWLAARFVSFRDSNYVVNVKIENYVCKV